MTWPFSRTNIGVLWDKLLEPVVQFFERRQVTTGQRTERRT